jgi:hypothetical protein
VICDAGISEKSIANAISADSILDARLFMFLMFIPTSYSLFSENDLYKESIAQTKKRMIPDYPN